MTLGIFGLISALALLIWLAMRGIDIIFAALLAALVVIITNDLPLANTLQMHFALGPLGAFSFAGKFFLLFACGAIFGRMMGDSGAAASLAVKLAQFLGAERALTIIVLATALLTYGGVVVFVVIFATYPLGLRLISEANIPKRLLAAAIALGAGTFTLTALPGTPSVQNVIASVALGTDLFAAPILGLAASLVMVILGLWYLERQRQHALHTQEGFVASAQDDSMHVSPGDLPHPGLALLPLVWVLLLILLPRLLITMSSPFEWVTYAQSQPILWPSIALLTGAVLCLIMFPRVRYRGLATMGQGTRDAILPLINTAAVIGFGGVVTQTPGFTQFTSLLLGADWPPLLSIFGSVSIISAITGSASGGLQIFMQTLAGSYLEAGIEPALLHRLAVIASGGFDSLPHCGAVVAMLTITQLSHRQAYRDIGMVTVVIPVIAVLVVMLLAALGVR